MKRQRETGGGVQSTKFPSYGKLMWPGSITPAKHDGDIDKDVTCRGPQPDYMYIVP